MRNCLMFLIDESAAMRSQVAQAAEGGALGLPASTKSKLESVATAVNSVIAKLRTAVDLDVGLIGYQTALDGTTEVGTRWPECFARQSLVATTELSTVDPPQETRVRRIMRSDGGFDEQSIAFPVWYAPRQGEGSPQASAVRLCRELLESWAQAHTADSVQAIVVHIMGACEVDAEFATAIRELTQVLPGDGAVRLLQVHLGSHDAVPATVAPANRAYVPLGTMRNLFDLTPELTEDLATAWRQKGVVVNAKARSMVFNARMIDFRRLCDALVDILNAKPATDRTDIGAISSPQAFKPESHKTAIGTENLAQAPPESTTTRSPNDGTLEDAANRASISSASPCLLVFVLDKSSETGDSASPNDASTILGNELAETLGWVAQIGKGSMDIALITYGANQQGEPTAAHVLLGGREFVRDTDLSSVAVRTEEYIEERSDGVGGLISIPRQRLFLVEVESATMCSIGPALAKAGEVATGWRRQQPSPTCFPPVIIHLTQAREAPLELCEGFADIRTAQNCVLYHFVLDKSVPVTVTVPSDGAQLQGSQLAYWECASIVLPPATQDSAKNPVLPGSRGLIINGTLRDFIQPLKCKMDG